MEKRANDQVNTILPKEFVAADREVIGLLQDKATVEIYAADKVRVKDKQSLCFLIIDKIRSLAIGRDTNKAGIL